MNININDITKACYNDVINKDKKSLSFKEIKEYNEDLKEQIISGIHYIDNYEKRDDEYVKALKSVLALAFMNNIDLNNFFNINVELDV